MAYVAAIKTGGLAASADFVHPDELQRFKNMFAPLFSDPKSPPAQRFAQAMFGPQATAESVAALDSLSFMRGVMSFKPYEDTRKLLLSGQLEGLAEALNPKPAPPQP